MKVVDCERGKNKMGRERRQPPSLYIPAHVQSHPVILLSHGVTTSNMMTHIVQHYLSHASQSTNQELTRINHGET